MFYELVEKKTLISGSICFLKFTQQPFAEHQPFAKCYNLYEILWTKEIKPAEQ